MPGVNEFKVQEILNRVFDPTNNRLLVGTGDNTLLGIGNDNDVGLYLRSTALSADAEITGVIVGTSDHQGVAANSLLVTNITANGDIGFYVNNGGNSLEAILIDTSALTIYLGFGTFTNVTFSAANSTNNSTFKVENTSNAAAASHSIVDIAVGGATSTGDPQLRLTVPGGTSWYVGVDNSFDEDGFIIGRGTAIGTAFFLRVRGNTSVSGAFPIIDFETMAGVTFTNSATNALTLVNVGTMTMTLSGTTTVTALNQLLAVQALTINQSGGAVTVNKAAGISSISVTAGASVTLTHSSAFRALTGGAAVNVSGLYVEPQTGGTTLNVQILMENGSTEPASAPANTVGIYAIDLSAATVLGIVAETAVVATADVPVTTKIIIRYNGVSYALLASTTLTGV